MQRAQTHWFVRLAVSVAVLLLLQGSAQHRSCVGTVVHLNCTDTTPTLTSNTIYVVVPGCYNENMLLQVDASTTNVTIQLVDAVVPILMNGANGVAIYMEHTKAAASQAMQNMSQESLFQLAGSNKDVNVTLHNVQWGPTNMSLLRPSGVLPSTEDTVVSMRNTSVHFTAAPSDPSRQYWLQLPPLVVNVNVSMSRCSVVTHWDRPPTAAHVGGEDGAAMGFIYIVLDVRGARGLRIDIDTSTLSAQVTCQVGVCNTTRSRLDLISFGFVVVNAYLKATDLVLDRYSLSITRSTLALLDTPASFTSMLVAFIRARWADDANAGNITVTGMALRITDVNANITGHNAASWVEFEGLRLVDGMVLEVARCSAQQLRRGLGVDVQLSNEASIAKMDRSNFARSTLLFEDVTGVLRTMAGDTNRDALDGSAGASAVVLHLGNATDCTLRIVRCAVHLEVLFGYASLKFNETARVFITCAACVLIDSDKPGGIRNGLVEIVDSVFNVSSSFFYSNRIAQLKGFVYLSSLSVVSITLGVAHNDVVIRNVTLSQHGSSAPVVTGVSFGSQVLLAVTQSGIWSAGSRPDSGVTALNQNNTILVEGSRIEGDEAAAQQAWERVPTAIRGEMLQYRELNVFALTGVQADSRFVANDVVARASPRLVVHGVCLLGAVTLPETIVLLVPELKGFDVVTQLQNSEVTLNSVHTVNGSALWLLYANPQAGETTPNATVAIRGSSFRSPGAIQLHGGFSAAVARTMPKDTQPLYRLSLHMSDTVLSGFVTVVDPDVVLWTNLLALDGLGTRDRFRFDCVTMNGAALTPTDTGVVRMFLDTAAIDSPCPLRLTRTPTHTTSHELPIPPLTRPPRGDHDMSPYLTVAAAVSSIAAPGAVILMQRSIAVLSLAACDPGVDAVPEASDSPLQLQLGNATTGGYIRGVVVGNMVLVVAACLLVMGGGLVATRVERGIGLLSWTLQAARVVGMPGFMLAPLGLLLQPTVAACVTAMGSLDGAGDVALGIVGVVAFLTPCCFLAWRVTARQECEAVSARLHERRGRQAKAPSSADRRSATSTENGRRDTTMLLRIARYLVAPEVVWIGRGRSARLFSAHFGSVFEGYTVHRAWFVCVEVAIAVAFGVLVGVRPQTEDGCRAQLWANFALSIAVLATAALRAYNGLLWNLNYGLNAIVMLGVAVMLLLERSTESGMMAMVMAWVGVSVALGDGVLHSVLRGVSKSIARFLRMLGFRVGEGYANDDEGDGGATTSPLFPNVTKLVHRSSIGRRGTNRGVTGDTLLTQFIRDLQTPRCPGRSNTPENALRLLIDIIAVQRRQIPPPGTSENVQYGQ